MLGFVVCIGGIVGGGGRGGYLIDFFLWLGWFD